MGSQAHGGQDRRFLPNSVRVLSQDRCIPLGMHGIANDWVTDRFTLDLRGEWAQCTVWPQQGLARSELCSVGTGVTEKVTKIDHSFLGLSSPVLFPGVREPSGASCVGLSFDLGCCPTWVK